MKYFQMFYFKSLNSTNLFWHRLVEVRFCAKNMKDRSSRYQQQQQLHDTKMAYMLLVFQWPGCEAAYHMFICTTQL